MKKLSKRRPRISMVKCRDRVQWLAAKLKREVTPHDIVKDARNPSTPYHAWFTWNQAAGWRKNLLWEARHLLGRIKFVYKDLSGNQVSVRKFVRLTLDAPATHTFKNGYQKSGAYITRERAMNTADLYRQMVELAWKDLETWKARYRSFKKIEIAFPLVDHAIRTLKSGRFRKVAAR